MTYAESQYSRDATWKKKSIHRHLTIMVRLKSGESCQHKQAQHLPKWWTTTDNHFSLEYPMKTVQKHMPRSEGQKSLHSAWMNLHTLISIHPITISWEDVQQLRFDRERERESRKNKTCARRYFTSWNNILPQSQVDHSISVAKTKCWTWWDFCSDLQKCLICIFHFIDNCFER